MQEGIHRSTDTNVLTPHSAPEYQLNELQLESAFIEPYPPTSVDSLHSDKNDAPVYDTAANDTAVNAPPASASASTRSASRKQLSMTSNAKSSHTMTPTLVNIAELIPGIIVSLDYAGVNNFLGTKIEGYQGEKALLTPEAAQALRSVQHDLRQQHLGLKIFDAYRPQRAVDQFVRWSQTPETNLANKEKYYPNLEKSALFNAGYLAKRSSHSRGSTVDLTIVHINEDGSHNELDMGTVFDFFDPRSWPNSEEVSLVAQKNRAFLQDIMMRHGFLPFETEWWHFTLADEPHPTHYFDIPIH